jgi:hypothetical protein
MPLLYGEGGPKAFFRLQDEIIKSSMDHSIFAWAPPRLHQGNTPVGFLAESPSDFANDRMAVPYQTDSEPYTMTNKGLSISLPIIAVHDVDQHLNSLPNHLSPGNVVAVLSCHSEADYNGPLCLELKPLGSGGTTDIYARTSRLLVTIALEALKKAEKRAVFISRSGYNALEVDSTTVFWIRWESKDPETALPIEDLVLKGTPKDQWVPGSGVLLQSSAPGKIARGAVLVEFNVGFNIETGGIEHTRNSRFAALFRADNGKGPALLLVNYSEISDGSPLLHDDNIEARCTNQHDTRILPLGVATAAIRVEMIMNKAVHVIVLGFQSR